VVFSEKEELPSQQTGSGREAVFKRPVADACSVIDFGSEYRTLIDRLFIRDRVVLLSVLYE